MKKHSDFLADDFALLLAHGSEIPAIVEYPSLVWFDEAHGALGHDAFTAAASADDKVDLAAFEGGTDVFEDVVITNDFSRCCNSIMSIQQHLSEHQVGYHDDDNGPHHRLGA